MRKSSVYHFVFLLINLAMLLGLLFINSLEHTLFLVSSICVLSLGFMVYSLIVLDKKRMNLIFTLLNAGIFCYQLLILISIILQKLGYFKSK